MKSLLSVFGVFLALSASAAQARSFLGISIGCDDDVRYSYCKGEHLKPSVRAAISRGLLDAARQSMEPLFGHSLCDKAHLSPQTPLQDCIYDNRIVGMAISREVFKDPSVKCFMNPEVLVGRAESLHILPRFDPYTGAERSLTIGDFNTLLQVSAEQDCSANR